MEDINTTLYWLRTGNIFGETEEFIIGIQQQINNSTVNTSPQFSIQQQINVQQIETIHHVSVRFIMLANRRPQTHRILIMLHQSSKDNVKSDT